MVLCQADLLGPDSVAASADLNAWQWAARDGVGKTQLAAHHARTVWREGAVELLVWVPAGRAAARRKGIERAFAQAGVEVAGADPHNQGRAVERFLLWAEATDRRWLVVLDDVIDPEDLRGLWPPHNPNGSTIITARHWDATPPDPAQIRIDVGAYTPSEAVSHLAVGLSNSGRTDQEEEIACLAAELRYLPVPLARAASYILANRIHCAAYRAKLAELSLPERLLGPSHDIVVHNRLQRLGSNLMFGTAGLPGRPDVHRAIVTECERLLPDLLIAYGPDHPSTLGVQADLASALQQAGETARAEKVMKRLVLELEKLHGPHDHRTTEARQRLARVRTDRPSASGQGP